MLRLLLASLLFSLSVRAATTSTGNFVNATKQGIVGDGTTLNTAAIQRAIDDCSAQGGGTLSFPAGRYLTGTIQLKDRVTLRLEDQAVLLGSTNAADYRNADPFVDGTGKELGFALVVTVDAKQVGIEGAGIIDGQGAALAATQSPYRVRPFLVRWVRCEGVTVKGVQLRNSGAWTMHLFQSKAITVEHVTIRSAGLPNNDGIDIDSSEGVRITGCDIDTGDDAICLKATSARACRDIVVTDCRLKSNCAAIKLGTESLGDFEAITISHCQIRDTRLGGIKLFSVDGAHMGNVTCSDLTMENVTVPIMIRLGSRLKTFRAGDQKRPVGTIRGVTIRNVKAIGARQIGFLISGIPGHPVESLTFENIDLQLEGGGKADEIKPLPENETAYPEVRMFGPAMPAYAFYMRHARGITFKNVRTTVTTPDARPARHFEDATEVTPPDFGQQ